MLLGNSRQVSETRMNLLKRTFYRRSFAVNGHPAFQYSLSMLCMVMFCLHGNFSFAAVSTSQTNLDYYSETQYQSNTKNLITQQRLRYNFQTQENLRSYFGVLFEMDSQSDATNVYNDNFVAPTVGVQWAPISFVGASLFAEFQYLQRLGALPEGRDQSLIDARVGLFIYEYLDTSIGDSFRLFSEVYFDSYFIHKAQNNFLANIWLKSGLRLFSKLPQIDFYMEGFAKRDRKRVPWENATGLRWGVRCRHQISNFGIAASIDRTLAFAGAANQRTPWRSQLVLSGLF